MPTQDSVYDSSLNENTPLSQGANPPRWRTNVSDGEQNDGVEGDDNP